MRIVNGERRITRNQHKVDIQLVVEREARFKMNFSIGSTVTKGNKPPSEHGVVTDVGKDTVTVSWHLKQEEGRGRAGTPVGKLYEDPTTLMSDTPCRYCKIS